MEQPHAGFRVLYDAGSGDASVCWPGHFRWRLHRLPIPGSSSSYYSVVDFIGLCGPGEMLSLLRTGYSCTKCKAGSYSAGFPQMAACVACAPGSFSSGDGAGACSPVQRDNSLQMLVRHLRHVWIRSHVARWQTCQLSDGSIAGIVIGCLVAVAPQQPRSAGIGDDTQQVRLPTHSIDNLWPICCSLLALCSEYGHAPAVARRAGSAAIPAQLSEGELQATIAWLNAVTNTYPKLKFEVTAIEPVARLRCTRNMRH